MKTINYEVPVVGVTFNGRQGLIRGLLETETLELKKENSIESHPNAIRVMWNNVCVGWISDKPGKSLAAKLAPKLSRLTIVSWRKVGFGKNHLGIRLAVEEELGPADNQIKEKPLELENKWLTGLDHLITKTITLGKEAKKKIGPAISRVKKTVEENIPRVKTEVKKRCDEISRNIREMTDHEDHTNKEVEKYMEK